MMETPFTPEQEERILALIGIRLEAERAARRQRVLPGWMPPRSYVVGQAGPETVMLPTGAAFPRCDKGPEDA